MVIVTIKSPIYVTIKSNKRFSLNLNVYRNAHHYILNDAKVEYARIMKSLLEGIPSCQKISIEYVLFLNTKRKTDTNNILSIVDKFFSDCLVSNNIIEDDNYEKIISTTFIFGGIDKNSSGYVIITITEEE